MNWIGIIIAGFCLSVGIAGYIKGFTKMIISAISLIVILIAAAIFEPVVAGLITRHTEMDETIRINCRRIIDDRMEEWNLEERTEQIAFIENMQIHKTVKADMIEDNNRVVYEHWNVNSFPEYLTNYLTHSVLAGVSYLLTFVIAYVIVKIVSGFIVDVSEVPVISFLNRSAGFLLGFFKGTILVCVMMLVLMMFSYTNTGEYLVEMVKADPIGSVCYEQNPIMEILIYFIKM